MKSTILKIMMDHEYGNTKRINHFMKVFAYSQMIALGEKVDNETQELIEITALMHDIGIKISKEKYQSSAGPYQEKEGAILARKILEKLNYDFKKIDRICYIIGHHHTYDHIDGIDYQIIVEADFLVNLDENNRDRETIEAVKNKIFQTKTGKDYLDALFAEVK